MDHQKKPRSFGTHDGSFHADEVTACALLLLFKLIDRDKIVRSRDPAVLSCCEYVCDVGGIYHPEIKLFDHHQIEYQGKMASAGMVLEYLKNHHYLQQDEYDLFNYALVLGVDAHDNGRDPPSVGICSFSHVVSNFMPITHEASEEMLNNAFFQALDFVYGHLKRMQERFHYIRSCRQVVSDAMARYKDCMIFEHPVPWMESFFDLGGIDHPAQFIIMPSNKYWKLRGIPPSMDEKMKVRLPLPEEWAGLLDADLKKVSGIPGAIFCHKGRFISVWKTRDDALKALEYILKKGKK